MRSLGLEGGAARNNSGDLAGELGRGVAGEGLGVERTRSGHSLAAETGPAAGRGGDRWRRPLGALLRRAGGSGGSTSERGGFRGARGR
jgi:hypothetical protein